MNYQTWGDLKAPPRHPSRVDKDLTNTIKQMPKDDQLFMYEKRKAYKNREVFTADAMKLIREYEDFIPKETMRSLFNAAVKHIFQSKADAKELEKILDGDRQ